VQEHDLTRRGGDELTRRQFAIRSVFAAASLSGAASVLTACGGDEKQDAGSSGSNATKTVTMASFGGAYNEAFERAFAAPFEKATGVKLKMASNTSLAGLKQQVAANAVQWDLAELTGSEYEIALKQQIPLEPLDFDTIRGDNIPEYARKDYGVKYAFFLQVMSWNRDKVKQGPSSWADFFSASAVPGKRSLYETLSDSMLLEFALIADGVEMSQLYPVDVDRALKVIESLGKDNIVWYASNQEVIQQMISNQTALGMPFTGRVLIANDDGANLGMTIEQGGAEGDYLVVPKGAKNRENAMKLIDFICNDVDSAASFMQETSYGLSNVKAIDKLPKDLADKIPTSPALEGHIFQRDDSWWAENLDQVTQKFQAFQANL
jgi:putative spermidine/putrescine transport system substrate-binding protein